jgi:hypothetical protein
VNREAGLNLDVLPTIFIEFNGSTTRQMAELCILMRSAKKCGAQTMEYD